MLKQRKTSEEQCTTKPTSPEFIDVSNDQQMSVKEYYAMFDKLPLKAIVPKCELMTKPGAIEFTEENIHVLPFGFNMIPLVDEKDSFKLELQVLKQDAGIRNAKIPLELAEQKTSTKDLDICAYCDEEGNSKCQNCMSVAYCCRDHQLAHWKDHRPFCVSYEIAKNPTDGYSVIAKTNIKKGEAIIIEEPYLTSPFSSDEDFGLLKFQPVSEENRNIQVGAYTVDEFEQNACKFPVVCIGCSACLSGGKDFCYDCSWPLCRNECAELARHREWECAYFREKKIVYEECCRAAVLSPRIFGIVKALLLKERDPQKWNMLSDETCQKTWTEKMEVDPNSRVNVEYLLVVLRNVFHFENIQYSDVCNVLAIIDLKGLYGCSFDQRKELCRRVTCVYQTASLIRHRCLGNVFTIQTNSGILHVIAARNIKKGEPLYRNHDKQRELQHIIYRQEFAISRTGKPCDCRLCVDPRVLDSSLSSILCLKCRRRGFQTYMSIETTSRADLSWKCHKCGTTKSYQQVRNLLQNITKDFEYFEAEASLRECISRYKGTILHPEHSNILAAELELIICMTNRVYSLQPEEVAYVIHLLNTRIGNLTKCIPCAHSSLVSMKMRLAIVLAHQVRQEYLGRSTSSKDILKTFENLQFIHDDIAASFVENTKTNALQGYILICLRKMRKLITEVGETLNMNIQRYRITQKFAELKLQNLEDASSCPDKKSKTESLDEFVAQTE